MNEQEKRAQELKASLVDHIGVSVWQASNAYVGEMYRRASEQGFDDLSVADGTIMGHLPFEGISIVGLATRRGATKQATHEAVMRLVKRGVLEIGPDPNDKRAKRVIHSERGLAFEAALQQIKRDMHSEVVSALGQNETSATEAALETISKLFERR